MSRVILLAQMLSRRSASGSREVNDVDIDADVSVVAFVSAVDVEDTVDSIVGDSLGCDAFNWGEEGAIVVSELWTWSFWRPFVNNGVVLLGIEMLPSMQL